MAYVLGYLYADGSLEDASYLRGRYMRVTSTDQDIISKIKRCLDSYHRIVSLPPSTPRRKRRYLLRIGNHQLYYSLVNRGLYPNKSLTVKFPEIAAEYLPHFVRGYFDGDGSIILRKEGGIRVIFTCGSKIFLQKMSKVIVGHFKTREGRVYNSQRSFQLIYSTNEALKILECIYRNKNDLFLGRKYLKLKLFLKKSRRSYNVTV